VHWPNFAYYSTAAGGRQPVHGLRQFGRVPVHRDHQGASIEKTAGYLARCLVTATVVIWLTLFAPLTCSYHGFLLRPGAMPAMASMPMGNMPMAGTHRHAGNQDAAPSSRVGFSPTLAGHHTSEGETAMLSLLMLAAPALYQLEPPAHSHGGFVDMPITALHPWPPPERPPRTA
jgi:hypothetical protein